MGPGAASTPPRSPDADAFVGLLRIIQNPEAAEAALKEHEARRTEIQGMRDSMQAETRRLASDKADAHAAIKAAADKERDLVAREQQVADATKAIEARESAYAANTASFEARQSRVEQEQREASIRLQDRERLLEIKQRDMAKAASDLEASVRKREEAAAAIQEQADTSRKKYENRMDALKRAAAAD